MLPLLLIACTPKDAGDSAPDDTGVTFAPPTVAIVTPMQYGQLRSTCTLTLDIHPTGDPDTLVTTVSYNARGGDWIGTGVEEGVQYDAVGAFDDCINTGDESGTFQSTAFSLVPGGLFLFWYAGTVTGFDTLQQEENFVGGTGVLRFETGTAPTFPDGVTGTDEGDGSWTIGYDAGTPIPEALGPFAAQAGYLYAEPDWLLYRPDWWQIQDR